MQAYFEKDIKDSGGFEVNEPTAVPNQPLAMPQFAIELFYLTTKGKAIVLATGEGAVSHQPSCAGPLKDCSKSGT